MFRCVFLFVVQAYRLNRVSAELARRAANDVTKQTGQLNFSSISLSVDKCVMPDSLGFPYVCNINCNLCVCVIRL